MSPIRSLNYDRGVFGERVIPSVTATTGQDGIDLLHEAARIPITPHTVVFHLKKQTVHYKHSRPVPFKARRHSQYQSNTTSVDLAIDVRAGLEYAVWN